jgi:hypothetical protein
VGVFNKINAINVTAVFDSNRNDRYALLIHAERKIPLFLFGKIEVIKKAYLQPYPDFCAF